MLYSLDFKPSYADSDVWMRAVTNSNDRPYYEYVAVYVDDLLILSHDHEGLMKALSQKYTVNPTSGRYLGMRVGTYTIAKDTEEEREAWFLSADEYLKHAIEIVEGRYKLNKKVDTPMASGYHTEVDESHYLDDSGANYYQSLNGILIWIVELGRIDVAFAVGSMSRFTSMPREGHLQSVLRIFGYLKSHIRSHLVMDPKTHDWSDLEEESYDWVSQYPEASEVLPHNMPEARGRPVQTTFFADAAHASDLVTRQSVTGILIFCNSTPIRWYSKRQNTVDSSAYG